MTSERREAVPNWPYRSDLRPCPQCNPEGTSGTCGFWDCDLCTFHDCDACGGLGWLEED